MANFGDILRKGRKVFNLKDSGGQYGRCEECGEYRLLYDFIDKEKEKWKLCETCSKDLIEELNQ